MKRIRICFGIIFLFIIQWNIIYSQGPELEWVKQFTGYTGVSAVNIDISGNIIITGGFKDTADFDPGEGVFELYSPVLTVYIAKLDASGKFIWAEKLDNFDVLTGTGIVSDHSGNIFLTGQFSATQDFDPGIGTAFMTSFGSRDAFILKLKASGEFAWVKQMGGDMNDFPEGIALDDDDNILTTGYFLDTADFDPGAGTYELVSGGNADSYILKLDASGNFVWAKQFTSGNSLISRALTSDSQNNVLTTGSFSYPGDFDPGTAVFRMDPSYLMKNDGFISKLNSDGGFSWAEQIGQYGNTEGEKISVDDSGNIYILGHFNNTADFDPGSGIYILGTMPLNEDGFVLKLDGSGKFVWAIALTLGELNSITIGPIAVDTRGNVYIAGDFSGSVDIDPGFGVQTLSTNGSGDAFFSLMDPDGRLLWGAQIGGPGDDGAASLLFDGQDHLIMAGYFSDSADFDPGPGTTVAHVKGGRVNAFIASWNVSHANDINAAKIPKIRLYPNPTGSDLTVDLGAATSRAKIEVFDMMGRMVMEESPSLVQNFTFSLPEAKGIYLVSVQLEDGERIMTKVVKY